MVRNHFSFMEARDPGGEIPVHPNEPTHLSTADLCRACVRLCSRDGRPFPMQWGMQQYVRQGTGAQRHTFAADLMQSEMEDLIRLWFCVLRHPSRALVAAAWLYRKSPDVESPWEKNPRIPMRMDNHTRKDRERLRGCINNLFGFEGKSADSRAA